MSKPTIGFIAACVTIAVMTGCTAPAAPSAKSAADVQPASPATDDLLYGEWELLSATTDGEDIPVGDGQPPRLRIPESGAGGYTLVCNGVSADIRFTNPRWEGEILVADLSIEPGMTTAVGCDEGEYSEALEGSTQASIVDENLVLSGGGSILTFERGAPTDRAALVDFPWQSHYRFGPTGNGKGLRGVAITYSDDGTFTASAGCQRLEGDWMIDASIVTPSNVSTVSIKNCKRVRDEENIVLALSNPYRATVYEQSGLTIASKKLHYGIHFSRE